MNYANQKTNNYEKNIIVENLALNLGGAFNVKFIGLETKPIKIEFTNNKLMLNKAFRGGSMYLEDCPYLKI